MKRAVIREHGLIHRQQENSFPGENVPGQQDSLDKIWLEPALFDRLFELERRNTEPRKAVFELRDRHLKVQQWVGVLQVPGLQLEILPKVDVPGPETDTVQHVRSNLLYMLSLSGTLHPRTRDLADLASRQAPLMELLCMLFARRLHEALSRGADRTYITEEDNRRTLKGRLLTRPHLLRNAARQDRFYCRYEEFSPDTPLNQVFRATCRTLIETTRASGIQNLLREGLLLLEGVRDVPVTLAMLDRIVLNRQNERFRDLLTFCRLVLAGRSPMLHGGQERSFSLLFDMNRVFERFIAGFLEREVMPGLHSEGYVLNSQSKREGEPLMKRGQKRILVLKPDLLFKRGEVRWVVDTKWKQLHSKKGSDQGGVGDDDLYQLYAYTHRFQCQRSFLLYPYVEGNSPMEFDLMDGDPQITPRQVCIRFVKLNRDLYREDQRQALASELRALVQEAGEVSAAR